jgi:hypothetical protein
MAAIDAIDVVFAKFKSIRVVPRMHFDNSQEMLPMLQRILENRKVEKIDLHYTMWKFQQDKQQPLLE